MADKPLLQTLRNRSTNEVIKVAPRKDPKSGEHIVLWNDVKNVFKNATSARIGDTIVSFMTDENFNEILPLRIPYHPGTELEVVVDNYDSGSLHQGAAGLGNMSPPGSSAPSAEAATASEALAQTVDALAITNPTTTNQSLAMRYAPVLEESQSGHPLYNTFMQSIKSGQEIQAAGIKQSMNIQFERLQLEMTKSKELQEQMIQMQKEMDEKQDHMLQMQQQALDRLAIIQSSVQAVLTQTYELHEYPIPRLFIVLPKSDGLSGKLKGIFSEQFRLYFLCECGTHTMSPDMKTPHQIHLAKHEGYDLDKPSAFFERYGPYVLTLMNMIKYGITAAGLIVPPLASSNILEGIDAAQDHLDNNEGGDELAEDHTEFDQLEALEGADLRQLESYLKVKDEGRVLGNLYRIVTSEGHVKWVCFDHYRATYREAAANQLREVVELNRGMYIEETGRVEIKLTSSALAKQFYDAMVKARWIQELEITLEWDASMDDLRSLANAATKSNLVRLTLDGTHLKSPALDVVNRARRFDPIMQLASNGRIQTLQLRGFSDFFARVSKSSLASSPKLRELSVESELPTQDKVKSLKNFTELYSSLTTLEMRLHQEGSISEAISTILNKLTNLESLQLNRGTFSVRMRVAECKIQDMVLTADQLEDITSDDLKFIHSQGIFKLAIRCSLKCWKAGVGDILRTSSISRIQTKHEGGHCKVVGATAEWSVQELVEMAGTPSTLEWLTIRSKRLALVAEYSKGKVLGMVMTVERLSDLDSDDIAFIQQGRLTRLVLDDIPREADKARLAEILGYNPGLTRIQIDCKKGHQAANYDYVKLPELFRLVQPDTLKELVSVSIENAFVAVNTGRDAMTVTIEQLSKLDPVDLAFIQQGHITRLEIRDIPLGTDEDRLVQIFQSNQGITHLQIGKKEKTAPAIASQPRMRFPDLLKLAISDTLSNLKSISIEDEGVSVQAEIPDDGVLDLELTIEQLSKLCPDELAFIQDGFLSSLTIRDTPQATDGNQLFQILQTNPGIADLTIGDEGPVDSQQLVRLQDLLKMAANTRSVLEFDIKYGSVYVAGSIVSSEIVAMTMIVDRLNVLGPDDASLMEKGHLTRVFIGNMLLRTDVGRLSRIVSLNPALRNLGISIPGGSELDVWGSAKVIKNASQCDIESLKINGDSVTLISGVSQGLFKDVELKVKRFEDLDPEALQFITRLAIKVTLEQEERRLTNILNQCPALIHLQIGCEGKRTLAITKLVVSTREKILKQRGSCSLRSFESRFMYLGDFEELSRDDSWTQIQSQITFSEGTKAFDMRSWIRLPERSMQSDNEPIRDFILQYGWSIVYFDGYLMDDLLGTLHTAINKAKTSKLESLRLYAKNFSSAINNILNDITKYSPNFKDLAYSTGNYDYKKTMSVLGPYGRFLTMLELYAWPECTSSFPTRSSFEKLESLIFTLDPGSVLSSRAVSWIIAMVSAPRGRFPPTNLKPLSLDAIDTEGAQSKESWTSLKSITLSNLKLEPEEWRGVIEAIDFSALQHLNLKGSNFTRMQFEQLKDRLIREDLIDLPLKTIDIEDVVLHGRSDLRSMTALKEVLSERAPLATVEGSFRFLGLD
ncbi:MAG: hypothetical protein J3Q66DRAFT_398236 [Benniella sp.]|nr:MAG: hypothetical protein J3Q66DRAFT_398236 [Benniella sp.]